jgi:hypothetical protein
MTTNQRAWIRPLLAAVALSALVPASALAAEALGSSTPPPPRPVASPSGPHALLDREDLVPAIAVSLPSAHIERIGSTRSHYMGSGVADWYATAQCESGGRWDINTGNGYVGGLQFTMSTWLSNGGGRFDGIGPFPYSADQQIVVAERVLATQGWQAWPHCFVWAS